MTQVRCSAKNCEHNEDGICKLPCIDLEESDMQYKDCGQSKERKDEPQADCNSCLYNDTWDDWEGDCYGCENASHYKPQTERSE